MSRSRFLASLGLAGLLLGLPAGVMAHTELSSSDPADGSVVSDPPTEVVLTFHGEIAEDATFTVAAPTGDAVGTGALDLDVADRNVLRGAVAVEEPGAYVVAYTVVGDDGHEITGEVTFTYEPAGTPPPDTALVGTRAAMGSVIAGLALIVAAALIVGRKAVRR